MKIFNTKVVLASIKAPDYTPTGPDALTAAICDDGCLVLLYMDEQGKTLYLGFNRWETSKVRSALNKGAGNV